MLHGRNKIQIYFDKLKTGKAQSNLLGTNRGTAFTEKVMGTVGQVLVLLRRCQM